MWGLTYNSLLLSISVFFTSSLYSLRTTCFRVICGYVSVCPLPSCFAQSQNANLILCPLTTGAVSPTPRILSHFRCQLWRFFQGKGPKTDPYSLLLSQHNFIFVLGYPVVLAPRWNSCHTPPPSNPGWMICSYSWFLRFCNYIFFRD